MRTKLKALFRREFIAFQWKTRWARLGPISRHLAARNPCRGEPLLILSLPRSGSSWVGRVFAQSPHVVYLREPITGPLLRFGITPSDFLLRKGCDPPRAIRKPFEAAFLGLPSVRMGLNAGSVSDWAFSSRKRKTLVIKEVNPFMLHYYLDRFNPRIIYLLRHPAAVAASYLKMGWGSGTKYWLFGFTAKQARANFTASALIGGSPRGKMVTYEEIARDPIGMFKELFAFANLPWSGEVESFLRSTMEARDIRNPYSCYRDTRNMADQWKRGMTKEQLRPIRQAYLAYDLPWYSAPTDWELPA